MSISWEAWSNGRIHEVKHRKKWEQQENIKYYRFIQAHKLILEEEDRHKKYQIYNRMAEFIGTRNTHQCRSHHQKIISKFGSIDQFCQVFRQKRLNSKESFNHTDLLQQNHQEFKKPYQKIDSQNIKNQNPNQFNLEKSSQQIIEESEQMAHQKLPNAQKTFSSDENGKNQKVIVLKNREKNIQASDIVADDQKRQKMRTQAKQAPKIQNERVDRAKSSFEPQTYKPSLFSSQQQFNFLPTVPFQYTNSSMLWSQQYSLELESRKKSLSFLQGWLHLSTSTLRPQESLTLLNDAINLMIEMQKQIKQKMMQPEQNVGFGPLDEHFQMRFFRNPYDEVTEENKKLKPTSIQQFPNFETQAKFYHPFTESFNMQHTSNQPKANPFYPSLPLYTKPQVQMQSNYMYQQPSHHYELPYRPLKDQNTPAMNYGNVFRYGQGDMGRNNWGR